MPKGVKLTLGDRLHRLLYAYPFDDGIDAIAEVLALGLKDNSMAYLHEVVGDLHLRACALRAELVMAEMRNPAPISNKEKIIKRTVRKTVAPKTAPKKVRRTLKGQAGKPDRLRLVKA